MTEPSSVKVEARKPNKKRYRTSTNIAELRENTRLSATAVEKIAHGQAINEEELISLFKSDSLTPLEQERFLLAIPNREALGLETPELFVEEPTIVHGYLDFWVPDIENEMIDFFRKSPEQLYSLAPRKFEELIAAIFRNNGFLVQLTPETRDGGVDIIAVQHSALTGESVNLIECKRYAKKNRVGIGVVQRLLGCVHEKRATKGILVTTSFFTKDAQRVAESSSHNLALNDYNGIVSWLSALPK
jgi:restriction system protein